MDMITAQKKLFKIYRLFDEFTSSLTLSCRRGCSDCCTRNVTLTGLEAAGIVQYLSSFGSGGQLFDKIKAESHQRRLQPQITTNGIAEYCAEGREIPDEQADPSWGSCPLLTDRECPVYSVRPFGCRCLISEHPCPEHGYARMQPLTVTIINIAMQVIEHLDAHGRFGNLTDMLMHMESQDFRLNSSPGEVNVPAAGLINNRPIKYLLIPPEHRVKAKPFLDSVQRICLTS